MAASKWIHIQQNYVFLSNKLYVSEVLLRYLYQESLISRDQLEQLRDSRELASAKLSRLFDILTSQDDSCFDTFCRCLRQVGQAHVAEVLESPVSQTVQSKQTARGEAVNSRFLQTVGAAGSGGLASSPQSSTFLVATDDQLEIIKDVVAGDWVPFGRALLKVSTDKVRDIVSPYAAEQLRASEKAYYVLDHWRQREGRHATVEAMLIACEKIDKRGAAELALSSDR